MSPSAHALPHQQLMPPNRREVLFWLFISAILTSMFAMITAVSFFAFPRPEIFTLGKVQDFSAVPTKVSIGSQQFWVVNIAGDIHVYDPATPHYTAWHYRWVPLNSRFEDPLTGAKFTLSGEYIEGPAHSGLDGYRPIILPDGTLQVNLWDKIEGGPPEKTIKGTEWCYTSCMGSTCNEVCSNIENP